MLPIRMQVGVSVGEQLVDYRCSRCGMVAMAAVAGAGTGLALNGVSVSNAQLDAEVGAAQAARLAPCPRCGHRSRAALLKVVLMGASIGVIAAMAAGFAAAEALHRSDPDGRAGTWVAAATFLAAVTVTTALKLRSVGRRVRFHRVVQ